MSEEEGQKKPRKQSMIPKGSPLKRRYKMRSRAKRKRVLKKRTVLNMTKKETLRIQYHLNKRKCRYNIYEKEFSFNKFYGYCVANVCEAANIDPKYFPLVLYFHQGVPFSREEFTLVCKDFSLPSPQKIFPYLNNKKHIIPIVGTIPLKHRKIDIEFETHYYKFHANLNHFATNFYKMMHELNKAEQESEPQLYDFNSDKVIGILKEIKRKTNAIKDNNKNY